MDNELINRLIIIVETNLEDENFDTEELSRRMGMSHSNLHRKLKSIRNQTISQFIREIRLKKAKELLQNENLTVAEISYRVGFGSPTYFNKCFHEYFGFAPGQLRTIEQDKESVVQTEELLIESNPIKQKHSKILITIAIGLIVTIPIVIFLIHTVSSSRAGKPNEKSIAILPFKYLSDETDKQYLADGMMDGILVHLSKIKDLRVISRTSVEQYRNTTKTSKKIGQELDVAYVLEGSFLKKGDNVRLILQLINTHDNGHAWSNEYDRQWKDIFSVQSEVSEVIAKELHAAITPAERQLIKKEPTSNLTAYDFYQRGKFELEKYPMSERDSTVLKKVQYLFLKALALDSSFAFAYTGLAAVYYQKYYWKSFLSKNFMDSVLILANMALSYDDQCAEAYYYRGHVYSETFKIGQALKEIDKALQFNPNYSRAYSLRSDIFELHQDYVGSISNLNEALLRYRGPMLPNLLRRFSYKLASCGYFDLGRKYNQQAFELDGDSSQYLDCLAWLEYSDENFESAYQIAKRDFIKDTSRHNELSHYSFMTGRLKESYLLDLKSIERIRKSGEIDLNIPKDFAYYLWQTGNKKEAEFYFNQQIKYYQDCIKFGRWSAIQRGSYFDLAEVYTILGSKDKAYSYLDEVNKNQAFPTWWVILFKYVPYFNSIRQEPRFQKILKDVEAKYQAEHERVGKWLKEQRML